MTSDKKSPGAGDAGAKVDITKQDLFNLFPPASQDLASVLREASYEERNKIVEAFCDYYRNGVSADDDFKIHWDRSPKDGLLILMRVDGDPLMVAITNYRPAFVFDIDAMRSVANAIYNNDAASCEVVDILSRWRENRNEFVDPENRRTWIAELEAERRSFDEKLAGLFREIDNPRNWFMPIAPICKIYVAPCGKAAE